MTVAEYAVLVRSDLKGRGLGWLLMQQIIEYARAERLQTIEGQVLRENVTMLSMCKRIRLRDQTRSSRRRSAFGKAFSGQLARVVLGFRTQLPLRPSDGAQGPPTDVDADVVRAREGLGPSRQGPRRIQPASR